eukprot:CAMPEP_0172725406 /NCGR_PEP_ID=MMETSP1074-20121228/88307_1 /TAXON_ID=2916 /ORGANISM="Ceratium fusus, Strain PA161109" /LENGTH=274 /DNA_ID=CAMNT_0013552169 /DNA_START=22 /DNA_END=846 /DNA_ORIENTATION=-
MEAAKRRRVHPTLILARPASATSVARSTTLGAKRIVVRNTRANGRSSSGPGTQAKTCNGPRGGADHSSSASHPDASNSSRGAKRGSSCFGSDVSAGSSAGRGADRGRGNCGRTLPARLSNPPQQPKISAQLSAQQKELLHQIIQACKSQPGHILPMWRVLQDRQKHEHVERAASANVGAGGQRPRSEPTWLAEAAQDCAASVVNQLSRGILAVTIKQRELRKEFRCSSEGAAAIQARTTVLLEAKGVMQRRTPGHSRQREYFRLQLADNPQTST